MCVHEGPYTANIGSLAACPPPPFFEAYVSTLQTAYTLHVFLNLFPHYWGSYPSIPHSRLSTAPACVASLLFSETKVQNIT